MATPNAKTTAVLVLELDDSGAATFDRMLRALKEHGITGEGTYLARYVVRDPEGIEDVLAITTGWTRNT